MAQPPRVTTQRDEPADTPIRAATVAEVMSHPPRTIDADAELWEARDALAASGAHHLFVEDRGRIVAVLSDRDVLRHTSPYAGGIAAQRRDDDTLRRHVFQVATYRMVTIHRDATVQEAAVRLLEHGISCLPVVNDHGTIVGVVTTRDLLRAMLECALRTAA